MTTVLIAAGVFATLFVMMAVGILLGRKPISGSCGGLGSGGACTTCGNGARGQCDKTDRDHSPATENDRPTERETVFTSLLR